MRPFSLAAVSALAVLPLLAACDTRRTAADEPKLWRVEAAEAPQKPVFICANQPIVAGFLQALPEIDGKPCNLLDKPIERDGQFIATCSAGDTRAVASSAITGDRKTAFSVITHVATRPADTTQAEPRGEFEQRRNYRAVGACPAGWNVGDTAAAGAAAVTNSTTGAGRALPAPFTPPS